MKNKKIIFLLALVLNLFMQNPVAKGVEEQVFYRLSDEMPLELIILLESYQLYDLSQEERERLGLRLKKWRKVIFSMPAKDFFLLVKGEIYRSTLDFPAKIARVGTVPSLNAQELEKIIEKNKKKYSPFSRWVAESILADLLAMKDFAERKVKRKQYQKLLIPWIGPLLKYDGPQLNHFNRPLVEQLIERLDRLLYWYADFIRLRPEGPSYQEKFFSAVPLKEILQKKEGSTSILKDFTFKRYSELKKQEALKLMEKIQIDESLRKNSKKVKQEAKSHWIPAEVPFDLLRPSPSGKSLK